METRKTPVWLIIILIIIILGLGGYIALDKLVFSKKTVDTKVSVDNITIDLNNLYQIEDILTKFDKAFNDPNSSYLGYLYRTDKLLASKFDNGAALFATIHSDLIGTNAAQYLIGENVKNNFGKIFGNNLMYNPTDVNAGDNYRIIYNKNNSTFNYTAPTNTNVYTPGYITVTLETEIKKDEILVTRKAIYVEYNGNATSTDVTKAFLYTNADKKRQVGEINLRNGVLSEKEILAKYASKFNNYQFTFKQNSNNENYAFYSIEKVN